jgi:hypothetical protein
MKKTPFSPVVDVVARRPVRTTKSLETDKFSSFYDGIAETVKDNKYTILAAVVLVVLIFVLLGLFVL